MCTFCHSKINDELQLAAILFSHNQVKPVPVAWYSWQHFGQDCKMAVAVNSHTCSCSQRCHFRNDLSRDNLKSLSTDKILVKRRYNIGNVVKTSLRVRGHPKLSTFHGSVLLGGGVGSPPHATLGGVLNMLIFINNGKYQLSRWLVLLWGEGVLKSSTDSLYYAENVDNFGRPLSLLSLNRYTLIHQPLPLRKNLLGSKCKAVNIYFAFLRTGPLGW